MKNKRSYLYTLVLAAAVATPAFAAGSHDHSPKFGGIVVETKAGDIEIVAKTNVVQLYISDHGKVVSLEGAKAKVTLLNGAEKSEVELQPAGSKMEAQGTFKVGKGTKGIAVLTLAGKAPTTARFEVK